MIILVAKTVIKITVGDIKIFLYASTALSIVNRWSKFVVYNNFMKQVIIYPNFIDDVSEA